MAKARKHRRLTKTEVADALKGIRRSLKARGISQPIKVQFAKAAADTGHCWEFVCEYKNGEEVCHWVEVPC